MFISIDLPCLNSMCFFFQLYFVISFVVRKQNYVNKENKLVDFCKIFPFICLICKQQIIEQKILKKKKQINEIKKNKKKILLMAIHQNQLLAFNFELVCSFKLLKIFTGHTSMVYNIDYLTFDDCSFICSGSYNQTIHECDVDNNKQIQTFIVCIYCLCICSLFLKFKNFKKSVMYVQ
ncbi:hypothetical protein RFI_29356 [Reticulomyxa filosa]|uniref:Transmembrane protein n=1 Tax=Reticulomyxa filosa TaxID=46433 RepID=X6M2C9_RETFI|nr:hypothetical protein RFI_29356 [Reticulomyxa filosa]|eukprot:ETO08034.1 hypothetical protein RFI_29356 [Reticulomyxa filosa]